MNRWPRRTVLASLIGSAVAFPGAVRVRAQPATPESEDTTPGAPHGELLPREVLLSLATVREVLPEMTSETATGANASAIGSPVATRSVTFDSADGTQHLVVSVDKYARAEDAAAAFQQASEMSEQVPGASGEAVPDLGESAFIGIVTQGDETHVGGGALFGDLIVAATLQNFPGTDENRAFVTEIIQRQAMQAARGC